MKKIKLCTMLVVGAMFMTNVQAYHQDQNPDIVIQSKFDYNWSRFLVEKVAKYLSTTKLGDPREKELTEAIIIEDFLFKPKGMGKRGEENSTDAMIASLTSELDVAVPTNAEMGPQDEGQKVIDRLLTNKSIKLAKYKITIEGLGYKINRATFGIMPEKETADSLEAQVSIRVGNMLVKAEKISIQLSMPHPKTGEYANLVEFVMTRPFIKTPSTKFDASGVAPSDISFNFNLKAEKKGSEYKFSLLKSTFGDIQRFIDEYGNSIKLAPHLDVNPSPFPLLRLGNVVWILVQDAADIEAKIAKKEFDLKKWLMNPETFNVPKSQVAGLEVRFVDMKGYFYKHQNDFKGLLLSEVFNIIKGGAGDDLLKKIDGFKFNTDMKVSGGDLLGKVGLEKIGTNQEGHVVVDLSSSLCHAKIHKEQGDKCFAPSKTVRHISEKDFDDSMEEITNSIKDGDSDLVVSISEAYITHALKSTFHAGMWDDALKSQPIEVNTKKNPNFIFMTLQEQGNFGWLVIDADYVGLQWYERWAVGRKRIRVALVYKVAIEVVKKDNIPHLLITLVDANMTDEVVRNGLPEFGAPSEIAKVPRFKKMVVKEARAEIKAAIGTKIEIPLAELNALGFGDVEYVRFASDGRGRANLKLKVKDSAKFRHVAPLLTKEDKLLQQRAILKPREEVIPTAEDLKE